MYKSALLCVLLATAYVATAEPVHDILNRLVPNQEDAVNALTDLVSDIAEHKPVQTMVSHVLEGIAKAVSHKQSTNSTVPAPVALKAGEEPCCATCVAPLVKYYSVDHGMGHAPFCGECCLDPSKYSIYHIFEKNLTLSDGLPNPCARQYTPDGQFYAVYNSTVTHGVPGILSVTLDLWGPN